MTTITVQGFFNVSTEASIQSFFNLWILDPCPFPYQLGHRFHTEVKLQFPVFVFRFDGWFLFIQKRWWSFWGCYRTNPPCTQWIWSSSWRYVIILLLLRGWCCCVNIYWPSDYWNGFKYCHHCRVLSVITLDISINVDLFHISLLFSVCGLIWIFTVGGCQIQPTVPHDRALHFVLFRASCPYIK